MGVHRIAPGEDGGLQPLLAPFTVTVAVAVALPPESVAVSVYVAVVVGETHAGLARFEQSVDHHLADGIDRLVVALIPAVIGYFLSRGKNAVSTSIFAVLLVLSRASYLRYLNPLNCEIDAPLVVKNVDAVPSGPTKLNGPFTLLLAAA